MLVQANAAEGTPAISGGARRVTNANIHLAQTPHTTHSLHLSLLLLARTPHPCVDGGHNDKIDKEGVATEEREGGATPHGWAYTQSFGLLRSSCGTSTQCMIGMNTSHCSSHCCTHVRW
jgi:hypothetical protein